MTDISLIDKIESRKAVIGILGLGYVGIPLMLRFSEVGFKVLGFDIDVKKVDLLNSGKSYIKQFPDSSIEEANKLGFVATSDFSKATEVDALIICVPTPLNKYREPDLSYVVSTSESIAPFLRQGQLVSLESTTYPGTTEEVLLPILEKSGLKVGRDFFLVYSPEREDPGNEKYNTKTIPKVCGGHTVKCLEVGKRLYESVIDHVVALSSTKAAEMTKLLENIHRAVNIGLVNELKIVSDKMGIDIHEVIDAAATKPFGFTPYYPGPGLGGHCIPIDPFYLTWKAREYGINTRFIELAGEVNSKMPDWVVEKISIALNKIGKPIKGSKILVLGIAYKKNVDDMRESPAALIINTLLEMGAIIQYSDPFVPRFPKMRKYNFSMDHQEITESLLNEIDCAVIVTNHDDFDYAFIKQHASLIVDTRGVYKENYPNVVKA